MADGWWLRCGRAAKCATFLLQFTSNLDEPGDGPKYMRMLVRTADVMLVGRR